MHTRTNIQYLIDKRNMTRNALAIATGIPQPSIHRLMKGDTAEPRCSTLKPIAEYFGMTVSDLRETDLLNPDAEVPRVLSACESEWLGLMDGLGSDDIAEFKALAMSRQQRNSRLLGELSGRQVQR